MTPPDPLVESHREEAAHAAAIANEANAKAREAEMRQVMQDMLSDGLMASMQDAVRDTIKTTVNGKIDTLRNENNQVMGEIRREISDHNIKHEADMEELKPIIVMFKQWQGDINTGRRAGKLALWAAGTISAFGGAWLILKSIFPWL